MNLKPTYSDTIFTRLNMKSILIKYNKFEDKISASMMQGSIAATLYSYESLNAG